MEIKTKYNVGDTVFHVIDCEFVQTKVENICINVGKNKTEIEYQCEDDFYGYENAKYTEDMLFASAEDLATWLKEHVRK